MSSFSCALGKRKMRCLIKYNILVSNQGDVQRSINSAFLCSHFAMSFKKRVNLSKICQNEC